MLPQDEPQRVGNIRIDGVLGQGGMGTVYVGYDEDLDRKVALKSIRTERKMTEKARVRFQREAKLLGRLEHPSICRIHGYVEQGGVEYLVLEYVEGATLKQHIEGKLLEPRHRLSIATQIAQALVIAHAHGVVHRDLKPDNVMITPEGRVKVLDFGLARAAESESTPSRGRSTLPSGSKSPGESFLASVDGASLAAEPRPSASAAGAVSASGHNSPAEALLATEVGHVVGTPLYMSPEQARGERITTASDMYSLGLVLQALYTGRSPYPDGLNQLEVVGMAARAQSLPLEGVPKPIAQLIERLKQKAPASRATAVETLERLEWIADTPARRLRRMALAALVLVAIGAGIKYTIDVTRERERAEARRDQAEDLLGFMLGDLREKLESVGRLDVLMAAAEKAFDYLSAVPEDELSTAELAFRTKNLYQVGSVQTMQGEYEDATETLELALDLGHRLLERSPDDAAAVSQVGLAHFYRGQILYQGGDEEAAREQFEHSHRMAERAFELVPDSIDYELEAVLEQSNLDMLAGDSGGLQRRLRRIEDILKRQPDHRQSLYELSQSHLILGDALSYEGQISSAYLHFQKALEPLEILLEEEPRNRTLLQDKVVLLGFLTATGLSLEDSERVDAFGREQIASARLLYALDESNVDNVDMLAQALSVLGNQQLADGDPAGSLEAFDESIALYDELVEKAPEFVRWWEMLLSVLAFRGRALELDGRLEDAWRTAERGEGVALRATEYGDTSFVRLGHSRHLQLKGRLILRGYPEGEDAARARELFQASLERIAPVASLDADLEFVEERAMALRLLGRHEEAELYCIKVNRAGTGSGLFSEVLELTSGP